MSNSRYAQIFNFLKEYYKLRETTVHDVFGSRKYPVCMGLQELEEAPGVLSWLGGDATLANGRLFCLDKPVAPVPPEKPLISEKLKPWLNDPEVDAKRQPRLKPSYQALPAGGSPDVLLLAEPPKAVEASFSRLSDQWQQYQREYRDYERREAAYRRHKLQYDQLFRCVNTVRTSGEKFEMVLGVGLFSWKKHKVIRRPLITIPVGLTIEDDGRISARLVPSFKIENEVLMGIPEVQIASATTRLREVLEVEHDDFEEMLRGLRSTGLAAFANQLSADCAYRQWMDDPQAAEEAPLLSFTPLLMLRERGLAGFTTLFENLVAQVAQDQSPAMPLLDRLAYSGRQYRAGKVLDAGSELPGLIFPKKTNSEQQKIVEKALREDLVLVQGPPGCGKSHAIANMVVYLLSRGQKVLVTAQTDQALHALKEHIPANFWDLVIFLLQGQSPTGYKLEKSVGALLKSISEYDAAQTDATILRQERDLATLTDEKETTIRHIQQRLRQSSQKHTINPRFADVEMADWGQRIIDQGVGNQWFRDLVADPEAALEIWPPLNDWQMLRRKVQGEEAPPEAGTLPDIDALPTPASLQRHRDQKMALRQQKEALRAFPARSADAGIFGRKVREWSVASSQITSEPCTWTDALKGSIQTNKKALWMDRKDQTRQFLDRVQAEQVLQLLSDYDVIIPDNLSYRQLREDVAIVMNYLKSGNELTAAFSRLMMPKPIRQRQYVYKSCKINGQPCNEWGRLAILAKIVQVGFELANLDELWHPYQSTEATAYRKIVDYRERADLLLQHLTHYPVCLENQRHLEAYFATGSLDWESPDTVGLLNRITEVLHRQAELAPFEKQLRSGLAHLKTFDEHHSLSRSLAKALKEEDTNGYHDHYTRLAGWLENHRQKTQVAELEAVLRKSIPLTLDALKENPVDLNHEDFMGAVYWSHAKGELEKMLEGRIEDQFKRLTKIEQRQQAIAGKYLKAKALKAFTEAISSADQLNQQLTRWQQAVRQGSGNGKLSYKYQREAQKKLTGISKSIPCWVMPLYRIVETIDPRPGMFDVVIVDEASQLGPEAIFFNYIAKKVVVVGDDQQTAPENVGVDLLSVQNLIQTHLAGIPDQAYFDTKHSFFDHMKAIAGQPVTLREHFRCMPEIIAFSNQICYRDLGIDLIPLKPFNHHRLAPLLSQYVENGKVHQDHNAPEANAIVNTIKQLTQDDAYRGKTFGIISLQGKDQAAAIDHQLRQTLPVKEYLERKIRCGTAPDFQGDERDIIFLSVVTAPNHRRSALTKRAFRRRYNVAMSRAKQQVRLFHSVKLEDLDKRDLRWQLLNFFQRQKHNDPLGYTPTTLSADTPPAPFATPFEWAVYQRLTREGWEVMPKVNVGPYSIDLVVKLKNGEQLAVECDGDEDLSPDQVRKKVDCQRVLERAGWTVFRIDQPLFLFDADGFIERVANGGNTRFPRSVNSGC